MFLAYVWGGKGHKQVKKSPFLYIWETKWKLEFRQSTQIWRDWRNFVSHIYKLSETLKTVRADIDRSKLRDKNEKRSKYFDYFWANRN